MKKAKSAPFRYQSQTPLHLTGHQLSLSDYEHLRQRILFDSEELESIPKHPHQGSVAETLSRACQMTFAIIDGGGLLSRSPDIELLKLRINIQDARLGFLSPPRSSSVLSLSTESEKTKADTPEENLLPKDNKIIPVTNIRIPLFASGTVAYCSFVRYRIEKQNAKDGENLVTPIPDLSPSEITELKEKLVWLESLSKPEDFKWKKVIKVWLNFQIKQCFGHKLEITWKELAKLAAWRLDELDRYSFMTSLRRNLFLTTTLPDGKLNDIYSAANNFNFIPSRKYSAEPVNKEEEPFLPAVIGSLPSDPEDDEAGEDILYKASSATDENLGLSAKEFVRTSQIIASIKTKQKGIRAARKFLQNEIKNLTSTPLKNKDLQQLIVFSEKKLGGGNSRSTVFTYASRLQRALFAMSGTSFSQLTTDDIAEYIDNYSTTASIENVLNPLQQFDNHLIDNNLAAAGHIDWASKSLKVKNFTATRDIITEEEFIRICKTLLDSNNLSPAEKNQCHCLLLLLRRCGLRAGEAAALTVHNFTKGCNTQLNITHSKTRAGRRSLPLYLLLDDAEHKLILDYLRSKAFSSDNKFLFTSEKNLPLSAAQIGRITQRLILLGGISGETGHGLRHAFANSLLSSFWLKISADSQNNKTYQNPFRAALEKFTRNNVEGRAVPNENCIRLLMGHADLRVTFQRYFHLLELVGADAVCQAEHSSNYTPEYLKISSAATILGYDQNLLRSEYPNGSMFPILEAARLGRERL